MKTSILAAVAAVSCALSVAVTAAAAAPGEKGNPGGLAASASKADFPGVTRVSWTLDRGAYTTAFTVAAARVLATYTSGGGSWS
jgi:hypothetical protein